jgi:hypothetical protein
MDFLTEWSYWNGSYIMNNRFYSYYRDHWCNIFSSVTNGEHAQNMLGSKEEISGETSELWHSKHVS